MAFEDLSLDDLVVRTSSHTPFFGVYLATHGIADAMCMCHASVGCKVKTQSHLVYHEGIRSAHRRRIYSQFIDEDLIQGSTEQLEAEIIAWQKRQGAAVVIIDPSTPISLQGQGFRGVIQRTEEKTGVPIIAVETRNYESDLYEGVGATTTAILKWLELKQRDAAAVEDDQLCIVGYPFDRYEQEHFGNVAELRRMLGHLGVKADSVFFSGEPWSQLVRARHARAFAVLPHAHQEAKVLRRAKVPFEKVGLPMGVGGTTRWLKAVGALMGVPDKRIRAYVKHELARIKPLAELARRQLEGRRFAVFAEAPRAAGVVALLAEVGMVPMIVSVQHFRLGGASAVDALLEGFHGMPPLGDRVTWQEDPTPAEVAALDVSRLDVCIGTTIERELLGDQPGAWLEFGYPSEQRHFLSPAPFLGFAGFARFLEQVMHACERGVSNWAVLRQRGGESREGEGPQAERSDKSDR